MSELSSTDQEAVDRLTLHLLQEAYCDLTDVLWSAQPKAAAAILAVIEQRIADILNRIVSQNLEGTASPAIALAVGERLHDIMGQAHGRELTALVA